jgi:GTP-binding protein EngB required for normal cell division
MTAFSAGQEFLEVLREHCQTLERSPALAASGKLLRDVSAHATEPLRVAVTGQVSTGKSSLVNALLGHQAAATAPQETTAEVTWFRASPAAECPPLGPHHRTRRLDAPVLKRVTIVDTPGFNTVSGNERLAKEMLNASTETAGAISVVVCLIDGSLDDLSARLLRSFAALVADPLDTGAGVIVVASKADRYRADAHPEGGTKAVSLILGSIEADSRHLTAQVLPLMPALAGAATEGTLDDECLDLLIEIASDRQLRRSAELGWPALRETATVDTLERIGRLEAMLGGPLGLRLACAVLAQRPASPAVALRNAWRGASGLKRLEELLGRLTADEAVLTSSAVLARLRRLADGLGPHLGAEIRTALDDLYRHPSALGYHRTVAALALEGRGLRGLSDTDRAEAARLLRGEPIRPTERAAASWRRIAGQPSRSARDRQVIQLVVGALSEVEHRGELAGDDA